LCCEYELARICEGRSKLRHYKEWACHSNTKLERHPSAKSLALSATLRQYSLLICDFFGGAFMTPNDFRRMALSFPDTTEQSHMNHPDFRVGGKIFATLAYPDKTRAMVKLTPVEQEMFVKSHPAMFVPVTGKWGLGGATSVFLKPAKPTVIRKALSAAWQLAAAKSPSKPSGAKKNKAK
jgi:hypothetical protein